MSAISLTHQTLDVSGVRLITVSDIVTDPDGNTLRIIKFYGDPAVNGAATEFVQIACRSTTKLDLEIQAPGFKF
jgi:hypothetical protein